MFRDELYHHGVLGQKWGVRRTPEQLGHQPSSTPRRKKSVVKSDKIRKFLDQHKSVKKMSNEELQARIARKKLEDTYRNYGSKESSGKGKRLVEDILTSSSKDIGTQLAKYLMGNAVNKVAREVFGVKENVVNPRGSSKDKSKDDDRSKDKFQEVINKAMSSTGQKEPKRADEYENGINKETNYTKKKKRTD